MLIREMLEQRERDTLSPDAAFFRTGAPGAAGAGVRYAHGVSAGPGQILHPSPFRRLETQNTGVSLAGGGSLPHPADAYAGGRADRAHDCARTAPE